MAALPCIVLVDDDSTTNFLNQALLRRMAVADSIHVATNGREALDLLHTYCMSSTSTICPALILLDLKMPIMNGLEFLEAYSQRAFDQRPVVVMLTTSLNPQGCGASARDAHRRLPHQAADPRQGDGAARAAFPGSC